MNGTPRPSALLRAVADSHVRCLVRGERVPIDLERARAQHRAHAAALEERGLAVEVLPADERFLDGCFVEDTAVALPGLMVLARPGAPRGPAKLRRSASRCAPCRTPARCT